MNSVKQFNTSCLANDVYRQKALIKYDIKLLENRLHKAIGDGKKNKLKNKDAAKYCAELIKCYEKSLDLLTHESKQTEQPLICCENSPLGIYTKIQTFKEQLPVSTSIADEIKIVEQLISFYKQLESQLILLQSQCNELMPATLTRTLKNLVHSDSPREWLLAVVAFANDSGENTLLHLSHIMHLSDKELLHLSELLQRDEFIALINSIFFYKINPQQLFDHLVHPEKLVSVQARLAMLHHFIEMIYKTVMDTLRQRGAREGNDYLFHGEDLPQGIAMDTANNFQTVITTAIKDWHTVTLINEEALVNKSKLYDLFRAYKFWFNPNRLIDAVVGLQQRLSMMGHGNSKNYKKFSQQMLQLYHQLTTTECLDLYGYFANKDTCYLMRTLSAAMYGQTLPSLPPLSYPEQETIRGIYNALESVMEAIRNELKNRHITTEAYQRDNSEKSIKPGRRNLNAVSRIIALYQDTNVEENDLLEQLFNEVEE